MMFNRLLTILNQVTRTSKVGFILSSDLPCTKNIQKIISVFANRTGRICHLSTSKLQQYAGEEMRRIRKHQQQIISRLIDIVAK